MKQSLPKRWRPIAEKMALIVLRIASLHCISLLSIDMSWRVRPSIRFCLSSCVVRSKGEAFPPRRCKLKKFNVVQPKASIILLFVREMLRTYNSGRTTREPDAVKGNRLLNHHRATSIVVLASCKMPFRSSRICTKII